MPIRFIAIVAIGAALEEIVIFFGQMGSRQAE